MGGQKEHGPLEIGLHVSSCFQGKQLFHFLKASWRIRNKFPLHGSNLNSNTIVFDLVCGELWFDFNSYDSYCVIHNRLSLFIKTKGSTSSCTIDCHIIPSHSDFDENLSNIVRNSQFVFYFSKIQPGGHATYGRSSYYSYSIITTNY